MNAAPRIAALFASGAVAYQTREDVPTDSLFAEEQQSLLRAVPKRSAEFAAGRACARAGLTQLGFAPVALPAAADRSPIWPAGATGSITHTHGFCAAVVARRAQIRALGVDAEPLDSVKPHLWRRICTSEELAILQTQDATAAVRAATIIFSAKEAFYKCQHTLSAEWLGFSDIDVELQADGFLIRPNRSLQITAHQPGPWPGRYLYDAGLVITAVCIV